MRSPTRSSTHRNVYLTERDVLPALDDWLAQSFTPANLDQTSEDLGAAQPDTADIDPDQAAAEAIIADCEAKLARHRQALEAGAGPALVAAGTAEVQARKAQALGESRRVVSLGVPRGGDRSVGPGR